MDDRAAAWFGFVRDLEYATDVGSHDAAAALACRSGDCAAKAALLVSGLAELGVEARLVRWVYQLPTWPGVCLPAYRRDLHTACEVRVGSARWTLVDPTYDVALRSIGLPVNEWGTEQTPAFRPIGRRYVLDDSATAAELTELTGQVLSGQTACGADELAAFRVSFNAYLRAARSPSD